MWRRSHPPFLTPQGNAGGAWGPSLVPLGIGPYGVDAARRDDVDADIMRGELRSQPAGEPDQAHLGRRDMGPSAATDEGPFAGEEQDAPVTVLDHRLDDRARKVERSIEDDPPDGFPILRRQFRERLVRPDGGIVDQDVDAAKLGQGPRRYRLDLIRPGDIGNNGQRPDAQGLGFTHDGIGLGLVGTGVDNDVSALRSKLQYRRSANIAARSGYQGDFPLKLSHEPTP
jgi:hypothetical protein